ncbi:MAG: Nif3-like dinuclear metal center hexameric protein [Solobacterium sp.]|nr:Nif3-like dinuclear metal center hexameric protein [Solobacterium sp.]
MLISEVIAKIKAYSRGLNKDGTPIDDSKTRDKVLYGETDKECTGIVTTCFASVDVIRKAHELNANLIIPHEALFWNHGDHTDWLTEDRNSVFLRKKALLDEYGITVWRDHDYIHSGLPDGNGGWYDGIFRGFLHETGLEKYYVPMVGNPVRFSGMPVEMLIPEGITVRKLAEKIIEGAGLNGIRLIGDPETVVHRIAIPMHCIGFADNAEIRNVNAHNTDCLITMELIDYTINEYMRDGMMLGDSKAILAVGHFNVEEPGMKYMLRWLPEALGTEAVPSWFVQSGDMNTFLVR